MHQLSKLIRTKDLPSIIKVFAVLRDAKLNEGGYDEVVMGLAAVASVTTSSKLFFDWSVVRYDQEPVSTSKHLQTTTTLTLRKRRRVGTSGFAADMSLDSNNGNSSVVGLLFNSHPV